MPLSLKSVATEKCVYPSQPRSQPDPAHCRALGESMKAIGQQVPLIGYSDPVADRFYVVDGGCRVEGARLCGISELLALDLGKKPTPMELLMTQAAIDVHRQHLPVLDRARLWQANMKERGCTAKQLAKELKVSDSLVGDYLSLLTLPPDVQAVVNNGTLHVSKAALIAQKESNPDRQRELAALAKDMPRDELATQLRQNRRQAQPAPAVKVSRLKCPLPSGVVIVASGAALSLDDLIDALAEAQRETKKAREQGLDAKTFQAVMRDKAKRR